MELIKKMSTKQLIEIFVETNAINDENIYMVRGWLMDELENRNKKAFDKWLEENAEDEALAEYFKV